MPRAKIGDIIEFKLSSGKLAYAQYTHNHERPKPKFSYGALLRILPGAFHDPPDDFEALARMPERFYQFFPLDFCLERGDIRIAGRAKIPEWAVPFPRFRDMRVVDKKTRKVSHWSLWDGEKSTPIEKMTPELARLSVLGKATPGYLVAQIESEYKPEDEV